MAKLLERAPRTRPAHRPRKAGSRRAHGLAGHPLRLSRSKEMVRRQAVLRRPPLRERLAARVADLKQQARRLEPPKDVSLPGLLRGAAKSFKESAFPHDVRDAERREHSGEPVVALVGAVDLVLLLIITMLLVIGTVMVYSASLAYALVQTDSPNYYVIRQAEWLALGFIGMYLAMRIDYRRWRILAGPGLVVTAILLLLLHTRYGVSINGSERWLQLSSFLSMEPSEFAKMGLVLYVAHWFAGQRPELRQSLRGLIPFGAVVAAMIAIVYKEPDLGTTAVIVVSLLMIYFVAGARLWHLGLLALAGAVGVKYALKHLPAYQIQRVDAWLNPQAQASGAGFHYIQSQYALGSGGLTGVGTGNSQLKFTIFMPHTDSIFAILGEEWGIIGTLGVMCLFLLFAVRGIRASILAPDLFGRLLAVGITGSIVFQALLNMAVVATVVPFTGITLPFISYGGSSLSISMVAAGVLLNISKYAIDIREDRDTTPSYFWWRNRRPSVSVAGRRRPTAARATLRRQPPSASPRHAHGR
ncbi:MAG TPA: putative peptidoglycan glycosyltransferase FtsW [Chloroflexota bacterium]|nr:putative peptidoglycan glycosyltransferase FtsW [Chloroflexota bacterium]